MPTHSFGDFHLKSNSHMFLITLLLLIIRYKNKFKVIHPSYITHKPEIKITKLEKKHKYIVLGSDGLCKYFFIYIIS